MGWRERDWAKLTDGERNALFGSGGGTYVAPSTRLTPAEHGNRVRAVVWSLVAVAVAGVGGFGYSQRQPARAVVVPPPAVVYGIAMSPTLVCDNEVLESQQWHCVDVRPVDEATRIVAPPPTTYGCVHVIADQTHGVWTCLTMAPSF